MILAIIFWWLFICMVFLLVMIATYIAAQAFYLVKDSIDKLRDERDNGIRTNYFGKPKFNCEYCGKETTEVDCIVCHGLGYDIDNGIDCHHPEIECGTCKVESSMFGTDWWNDYKGPSFEDQPYDQDDPYP